MKLVLVILFSCIASWFCSKPALVLVDATQYSYAGGRKESGKGMAYTFLLKSFNSKQNPQITNIYFKNSKQIVKTSDASAISVSKNGESDTSAIEVTVRRHWVQNATGTMVESEGTQVVADYPIKYSGEALIEYQVKDKKWYLKVDKIRLLPSQNYQ